MTPPATPSEVKPYKKPEVIEQEVKPEPEVKPEVVKPSPIELSDVVPMVAPAVAPTKLTEAVSYGLLFSVSIIVFPIFRVLLT